MPKKKEPPRTRAEQERIFKEAAKASGADESGKKFEAAMKRVIASAPPKAKLRKR